ncbi:hypothetical protein VTO73DRAFT_5277 [Trametes versicolor]
MTSSHRRSEQVLRGFLRRTVAVLWRSISRLSFLYSASASGTVVGLPKLPFLVLTASYQRRRSNTSSTTSFF